MFIDIAVVERRDGGAVVEEEDKRASAIGKTDEEGVVDERGVIVDGDGVEHLRDEERDGVRVEVVAVADGAKFVDRHAAERAIRGDKSGDFVTLQDIGSDDRIGFFNVVLKHLWVIRGVLVGEHPRVDRREDEDGDSREEGSDEPNEPFRAPRERGYARAKEQEEEQEGILDDRGSRGDGDELAETLAAVGTANKGDVGQKDGEEDEEESGGGIHQTAADVGSKADAEEELANDTKSSKDESHAHREEAKGVDIDLELVDGKEFGDSGDNKEEAKEDFEAKEGVMKKSGHDSNRKK